jgi:putative ABC transport system permease protein
MDNVLRDARIGLRLLWKHRGFTAVAVLTIALGIAANTAIFSVIYATFFEPLPYRDADRLVMVWSQHDADRYSVSPGEFVEWKRQASVFEDVNAWTWWAATVSTGGRPEQMQIGPATPGFLPMFGYGHPLALGRDFLEEEGTPGKDQVVILTHRLWRDRFGSDPNVIGRPIRIERKPYTVVGVLGAGPADENQNQLWVPLALTLDQLDQRFGQLLVMGRLKAGVTLQQANVNMETVSRNVAKTLGPPASERKASVQPFRNNFLSNDTKRGLWLLLGAVAFVLLIACANVANLLLARGSVRQRELAVRASLGASRARIVGQLLIESLVLAMVGGALGVALAAGLLQVVVALMPPYMLPTEANVRLNLPVLLLTLAACGLCGILFGAAPAWQATRASVNDILKEGGRALSGGGHRLRHALVLAEFALALTLLAGGGLAIQSLFTLTSRDVGFRADHLLTFYLPVDPDKLTGAEQITVSYQQLIERMQGEPGVVSASLSTGIPVYGPGGRMPFHVAGKPIPDPSRRPVAGFSMVSPEYFNTFRILMTRGRTFTDQDRSGGVPVAIVNETFVKQYLPNVDPLTQRIVVPRLIPGAAGLGPPVEWQIVGVSADVQHMDPANERLSEIHVPFWQSPWPDVRIALRTAGEPASVQQGIAAIVQSLDPELPMAGVKTMEQIVSESLVRDRFNTVLFGSFAAVGLLLAAFGIYGVMSFVVAQRTHEIGLRMALGADRWHILRRIVSEGMITAVTGTAIGSAGAFFYVARTMRGVVSGIGEMDTAAFFVVALTLICAALIACVVPAARAASVDPMMALRQE